jgi:hypothetical protein
VFGSCKFNEIKEFFGSTYVNFTYVVGLPRQQRKKPIYGITDNKTKPSEEYLLKSAVF